MDQLLVSKTIPIQIISWYNHEIDEAKSINNFRFLQTSYNRSIKLWIEKIKKKSEGEI